MLVELVASRDPRLRQPTFSIPRSQIHYPVIQDMINALILKLELDRETVGIAAPQLGFNNRIFVARLSGEPVVFINPEWYLKSIAQVPKTEECLSLPGVKRRVLRHKRIGAIAFDRFGQIFDWESRTEEEAAMFQHEMDHLNGVLITDRPAIRRLPRIFG